MVAEVDDEVVYADEEWLAHIHNPNTPYPHKMFTDQAYHFSFWQNAEHSIILIDEAGKIISANPRFCNLIDTTLAEIKGNSFYELIDSRFFKRDLVNIEAIIDSKVYSYINRSQIKTNKKKTNLIPVKVVATRVPATLNHPFRHVIIHLYEMPDATIIRNREVVDLQMQADGWKGVLRQPWFIKSAIWLVALLAILISLSGNLLPLIEKLIDKI